MSVITKGFPYGMRILVRGFGSGGITGFIVKVIYLVSKITKR